jgi:uncharacterized protein (TIGR02001 family)
VGVIGILGSALRLQSTQLVRTHLGPLVWGMSLLGDWLPVFTSEIKGAQGVARKLQLQVGPTQKRTPDGDFMKRHHLNLIAIAAIAFTAASAARAEEPASPFTFNVGGVSDYRYRGISQTRLKPALQGGVDFAHSSGFYLGAWASTIKWIEDSYGDAKLEIDLYGGYKGEIAKDLTYDVGVLQYLYPSAKTKLWDASYKDPNTTEIYGAITFGPVTTKLSYALTNLFGNYDFGGNKDSKGSIYLDVSASFDVGGGVMLAPHVGYQKIQNITNASYTDYSLTVSKDFSGLVPSIAVVGTNANKNFYVPGGAANSTKFLGKTALVVGAKYSF